MREENGPRKGPWRPRRGRRILRGPLCRREKGHCPSEEEAVYAKLFVFP